MPIGFAGAGISEAPVDGSAYARKDGAWSTINTQLMAGVAANYAALPAAANHTGELYYVQAGSGGLMSWAGFYKYPVGMYVSDGATWTLSQIQATVAEDTLTISNITNWTEFVAAVSDVNIGDRIIFNGTEYVNLTGALTATAPSTDLVNWAYAINQSNTITAEATGFTDPGSVIVSYDGTARTITLTGTVEAYWRGQKIPALVSGWVSDPHAVGSGTYFLVYNGSAFVWSSTPWDFSQLQIALVFRDTANFCLRECHGLMTWQAHKEFHETLGTYLGSGGDLSAYTLASTTAADRRPNIASTLIYDEDLPTTNVSLTSKLYSWLFLSGAGTANITNDNAEVINLSTNNPYYNQFTGGNWQQTLFPNNAYGKIFVMAIPTTADATCQKSRFVFVQPQTVSTTLATIQAITPASVNIGHIATALAEYVFIGEIIVRYAAGNWTFISVTKLTGTKIYQTATPAGNFLSSVTTDGSLTGDGTAGIPLGINTDRTSGALELNTDGTNTPVLFSAYNAAAASGGISFRRGRGTKALPTQTQADDVLGALYFAGTTDGAIATGNIIAIRALAAEAHTATAQGAYLSFSTTPVGGTGRLQRLNISAAGSMTHTMAGNAATGFSTQNTDNGTLAETRLVVNSNSGTAAVSISLPAAGNTAAALFGITRANGAFIFSNTATARDFAIGTIDAKALVFGTNNAERMRILSGGNVGIGVLAPDRLLDVQKSTNSGTDSVVPALRAFNSLATQGNGTSTFNFASVEVTAGNGAVGGLMSASYSSDAVYGSRLRFGTTTDHGIAFLANNVECMSITNGGYTKIGPSTAPAIRVKKLTGTTGAAAGVTTVAHGLTGDKIISMSVKIITATNNGTPPGYPSASYSYSFYHDTTSVAVETTAGATNVFSKAFVVTIIYEE